LLDICQWNNSKHRADIHTAHEGANPHPLPPPPPNPPPNPPPGSPKGNWAEATPVRASMIVGNFMIRFLELSESGYSKF
jgi:hypothetical protein